MVVVGYMANNLLPMRLGELVRTLLRRRTGGHQQDVGPGDHISSNAHLDALTLLFFIAAALRSSSRWAGLAESFAEQVRCPAVAAARRLDHRAFLRSQFAAHADRVAHFFPDRAFGCGYRRGL